MINIKNLIILSLFTISCASPPKNLNYPIKEYHQTAPKIRITKLINIKIDNTFSTKQKEKINKACQTWEEASNHKLKFNLEWDQPKPGFYKTFAVPTDNQGVFFWNLQKNNKELSIQELIEWNNFIGLTVKSRNKQSGHIIIFTDTSKFDFYSVALHEIGHFIGLKHNLSGDSVMHPINIIEELSNEDIKNLCDIYHC